MERDGFCCVICGRDVSRKGQARIDHIKPRRTYPHLAHKLDNLRTLCTDCDAQAHREKGMPHYSGPRVEKFAVKGFDVDGVPLDPNHHWHTGAATLPQSDDPHPPGLKPSTIPLTVVCGAPCSGKTTWVAEHARPSDLVLDLDQIAAELSGLPLHDWPRVPWLRLALAHRNRLLGEIGKPCRWSRAWLIVSEPNDNWRDWWRRALRPESIVVLDPGIETCLARMRQRGGDPQSIKQWYWRFRPLETDTVIHEKSRQDLFGG